MITFSKATKKQGRLKVALIGPSGSGKTYTALALSTMLVNGHPPKVALIDTEHGSASKYADRFSFDTLELESFSPLRYIEAIQAAEAAGYDVLVIDSLSHAWAGKDGALEMVDRIAKRSGSSGNKFTAWGEVTPIWNQLLDLIVGCRMHVVGTFRAKSEYILETNDKGKAIPRKVGMGAISRDQAEYEFDIVGELDMDNNLIVTKTRCPALAGAVIPKPGKELATTLMDWITTGVPAPAPLSSSELAEQETLIAELRAIRESLRNLGQKLEPIEPKTLRQQGLETLRKMVLDYEALLDEVRSRVEKENG